MIKWIMGDAHHMVWGPAPISRKEGLVLEQAKTYGSTTEAELDVCQGNGIIVGGPVGSA